MAADEDKKDDVKAVVYDQNLNAEERAHFNQPIDRARFLKALRGEDPDYILLWHGTNPDVNWVAGFERKPELKTKPK